ncbi:4-hydroxy-tetrahydrodipicolinate reductase [Helicobacter sp. 12S02232-10]|uniref:4-hydroxy-tetrahydrodipicolinate reductase n=1 Tax=Helicobacter sp. 12S02232-10 TaxID=1476197 RepID=UPI000BA7C811|nr:4-hydroxy-tetrahydrodipicolinate reductase [Helicobacter sp. 12S02232-10]PAF47008.1 4-hydroxy-tetrahydrodipicolinate reductase [Helicobacter sp. 12S02232-10]
MKIGVFGASGRIGRLLIEEISKSKTFTLGSVFIRKELNFALPENTFVTNDIESFIQHCEIVIDFSLPNATLSLLNAALKKPLPIVSGTTGLDKKAFDLIKELSKFVPVLYATNMSKGIAMLNKILPIVTQGLSEADIEICEIHHRHKKDAPSGTALSLGETCAKAKNLDLEKVRVSSRDGNIGERKQNEIAIMSLRGGDVAGRHTVGFYMDGEYLEFTHNATSRLTFAKGALDAAKWLIKQEKGLYGIQDIFSKF